MKPDKFNLKSYADEGADLRQIFFEDNNEILRKIAKEIASCFQLGNKLLIFGNGGSASQAQHFAGELVGRFQNDRSPLPAIALTADSSVLTCIGNDFGFAQIFARQIEAFGKPGDIVFAISTSGQSDNVMLAAVTAHRKNIIAIGLTGRRGLSLANECNHRLIVDSISTPLIQEIHIAAIHALCYLIEEEMGED